MTTFEEIAWSLQCFIDAVIIAWIYLHMARHRAQFGPAQMKLARVLRDFDRQNKDPN